MRKSMRVSPYLLRSILVVAFLLDLVLIFVMMQQQNPYSYDHQEAKFDRYNQIVYATVFYAFLGLGVLLGAVAVLSRSIRRREQQTQISTSHETKVQSEPVPNKQLPPLG